MSSSMRWRKGVMGRWIFMTRLLALREMTSWVWRCGHALYAGVIVRWTGWDDEPDAGHQGRFGRGFVQRVGELFSSITLIRSQSLAGRKRWGHWCKLTCRGGNMYSSEYNCIREVRWG